MLTFRCDPCEVDFNSEPDDTGYEQAACPACGHLCVTHEFIDQEARRYQLPRPQFTLRTLLLIITIGSAFLALSIANHSEYCNVAHMISVYGFPFQAISTHAGLHSVDWEPLMGDVLVFLVVYFGISRGLTWFGSWRAERRVIAHPARRSLRESLDD